MSTSDEKDDDWVEVGSDSSVRSVTKKKKEEGRSGGAQSQQHDSDDGHAAKAQPNVRGKRRVKRKQMMMCLLVASCTTLFAILIQFSTWKRANNGYLLSVFGGAAPDLQGFLSSKEEVEQWAAGGNAHKDLLSFIGNTNFERDIVFVYTHTHSGSGMDDPTARARLWGSVLDVKWYDQCTDKWRTMDLRYARLVVAVRLDPNVITSVHMHGLQVQPHTFTIGDLEDKASAFATLRGLDELKNKSNQELTALTSVSIKNADHSRLLQALAYLPHLEELVTTGIHWRYSTLVLLGNLTSLKTLRVGGRYWEEPNNFKYIDLEALTTLSNLESLDLSYTSIDGAKGDIFAIFDKANNNEDEESRDQRLREEFAQGMEIILKFPKLKQLTLGAQMYPEGAKLLAVHPSLAALHGVEHLSYEVTQSLANSGLVMQLTSLDFKGTKNDQPTAPIIAQIAKFTNLTHLGMHRVNGLDDAAMLEVAPLVKLKQLYVPSSNIGSEGLKVFHQLPNVSVLSLGYCRSIEDGLEHITQLNLTHLDLRSIKGLKMEDLIPVLKASPNLIDLNLRYAESVDATALAKEADLSQLKFLNVFSTAGPGASLALKLKLFGTTFYQEDQPFHSPPAFYV